MIAVTEIEGKGRGLVATQEIPQGETITWGPIKEVPKDSLAEGPLENHYWSKDGRDFVTFGPHTMCNHDDNPSCESIIEGDLDILKSRRLIKPGEELTIDYEEWS